MSLMCFCSPKGGVGKTSLSANVAGVLARIGLRTLLVDLDVQNSLRLHLGVPLSDDRGLASCLVNGRSIREGVIASPGTPPHVYAAACFDAAQALERQGGIARAIELYELTVAAFGVDPRAKSSAQRAIARLVKPV